MPYWGSHEVLHMQLHPSDSAQSVSHVMGSLGIGYVGLDFADLPRDLTELVARTFPSDSAITGNLPAPCLG